MKAFNLCDAAFIELRTLREAVKNLVELLTEIIPKDLPEGWPG